MGRKRKFRANDIKALGLRDMVYRGIRLKLERERAEAEKRVFLEMVRRGELV